MEIASKKIQTFYKIYIKTDRDSNGFPLDPISMEPISKENIVKILCFHKEIPIKTQYFDIVTLDLWFKERKDAINPLTNLEFTKPQINKIYNKYLEIGIHIPYFIKPYSVSKYNTTESELYEYSKNPRDINKFRKILMENYGKLNLNSTFSSKSYFLNKETILMSCVINDNFEALQELLLFDVNLDFIDTRFGYKALDLSIISKKPNSCLMLNTLLFHGARVDLETKRGYSIELTNDIEKIQIYYNFLGI